MFVCLFFGFWMKDPKLEQTNKRVRDEKYAVDCKHIIITGIRRRDWKHTGWWADEGRRSKHITHHKRVDHQVIVFESIESRRSTDTVLTWLTELQTRQHRHKHSKHKVIVNLHWREKPPAQVEKKEKRNLRPGNSPLRPLPALSASGPSLVRFLEKKPERRTRRRGKKKDWKHQQLGNLGHKPECLSSPHCYSKSGTNKMRRAGGERGGNREGEEGGEEGGRKENKNWSNGHHLQMDSI